MLDKNILLSNCKTDTQIKNVTAYFENGMNYSAAGRELGVTLNAVKKCVKLVGKYAADNGNIENHPHLDIAEGRKLGKVTTQIGPDGEVKNVWYRQNDKLASIDDALHEMCERVTGKAPKIKAPKLCNADVLSSYNIGDMHIAMHAWGEETGVDFDIDIAVHDLINAMSDLIARATKSETCILLNLGDAIHFHDDTHSTKGNKNPLDADSRVHKAFRITCDLMNTFVEMALQKHKKVIVRNVIGNHDEELAMALKFQMDAYWRNEKRVSVEMSPADNWFFEFGKVMLMATHGHNMPPIKMIPYMSARESEMWGRTLCRRALHGHFHSKSVIECLGGKVEGFSNLAPNDAWHASKGYLSELECVLIEYHKCGKEIGRQNFVLLPKEVGDSGDAGMSGKL